MRRRSSREPAPEMPAHLRDFDAAAWGWSGPHYVDGYIVTGYNKAWNRFLTARTAWCDEHPTFDWLEDILRHHPDEPWGVSA